MIEFQLPEHIANQIGLSQDVGGASDARHLAAL